MTLHFYQSFVSSLCLSLPLPLWRRLALGGVGEEALTPEHFPIQWGEAAGRFWVEQAEKFQLVDVEVADGLYCGKLSQHLQTRIKKNPLLL